MTTEITNSVQLRRYIRASVTQAVVEQVARRPRGRYTIRQLITRDARWMLEHSFRT